MSLLSARESSERLEQLMAHERSCLVEFLLALSRFDKDRLWVSLGYNSLFTYLAGELRLSSGAAFYRNTAARLIQICPEVVEPLRDGRLCLTVLAEVARVLTAENSADVLPRFFHASKRDAKELSVTLFPIPNPNPPERTVLHTGFPEKLVAPSTIPSFVPPRDVDEPVSASLHRLHIT